MTRVMASNEGEYHQRAKIETVHSVEKRLMGSHVGWISEDDRVTARGAHGAYVYALKFYGSADPCTVSLILSLFGLIF